MLKRTLFTEELTSLLRLLDLLKALGLAEGLSSVIEQRPALINSNGIVEPLFFDKHYGCVVSFWDEWTEVSKTRFKVRDRDV